MDQVIIGKNIQRWRSFRGKKQQTFAKEIGVSRVMLSRYENGRSGISLEHLEEISTSLGISIWELLNESF